MIRNVTGYITPELIRSGGDAWAKVWLQLAQTAAQNGNELVVIEVKPSDVFFTDKNVEAAFFDEPFI